MVYCRIVLLFFLRFLLFLCSVRVHEVEGILTSGWLQFLLCILCLQFAMDLFPILQFYLVKFLPLAI